MVHAVVPLELVAARSTEVARVTRQGFILGMRLLVSLHMLPRCERLACKQNKKMLNEGKGHARNTAVEVAGGVQPQAEVGREVWPGGGSRGGGQVLTQRGDPHDGKNNDHDDDTYMTPNNKISFLVFVL